MSPTAAWAVLIVGFVLPLIHVAVSRDISSKNTAPASSATVPASEDGAKCPFSPRLGWLVIVLFLGPIGWLMFINSRRRKRALLAATAARKQAEADRTAP
jgi:hypothetical protein